MTNLLPFVSIVVLNYNKKFLSAKCLTQILDVTNYPNFEILFVDNGSKDGSVEYIREKFCNDGRVKILALKNNFGYPLGNNMGVASAMGEYVAIVNNDVTVTTNWLGELIAAIQENPLIVAAQGKIYVEGTNKFDSTGLFMDYFGNSIKRGETEIDRGQYEVRSEIFSFSGACFIIKKSIFNQIGGFDKDYFLMFEEIDLSWRVRLAGYKIIYVPTSVVYHAVGNSTKKTPPIVRFHDTKNKLITFLKNADLDKLLIYNPCIAVFGGLLLDATRKKKRALSVMMPKFRAILWVMKNLRSIFQARYNIQRNAKVDLMPSRYSDMLMIFLLKRKYGYQHSKQYHYLLIKDYIENFSS